MAVTEAIVIKSVQVYIGTYICVVSLCLLSVWYPDLKYKRMGVVGDKLSLYVYIYHIAVGKIFDLFAQKYNLWHNVLFKTTRPLLVLSTSLAVAGLIVWAKGKCKKTKTQLKGICR